jgi:glutamine synthetase
VTFAPILEPDGTGNGVHIHFSFRDRAGKPATHDPGGAAGLTSTASHFMAGILAHMPALCAITAPSSVSYIRLRPNKWAPTFAYLADRDREASLRVCPVLSLPGGDVGKSYNVEFRVADGAASPYLALGALVHAGIDGIRRRLPLKPAAHVATMSEEAREAAGIKPLPRTLGEALNALEHDAAAKEWFGVTYLDAYLRHKRAEIRMLRDADEAEQCRRYGASY